MVSTLKTDSHTYNGTRDSGDSLQLKVIQRNQSAEDVIELTLARADGGSLPTWTPGAHIDMHIGEGYVNQYSLCSNPEDLNHWRVAILRVPNSRGGSHYIHDSLHVGATIEVSLPRNNFRLDPADRYVFIAGGIGITPILPMIRQADLYGAAWNLIYVGRSRSSMAFLGELDQFDERVEVVASDTDGRFDFTDYLSTIQSDTLVYACGPETLLQTLDTATADWPSGSLHVERFTPTHYETTEDTSFEVEFEYSGIVATVPGQKTILEVAEDNGVPVESSCREGTCGTCETFIVAGEVEHRDSILTDVEKSEGESMFICVSRAEKSCPRLVLDL